MELNEANFARIIRENKGTIYTVCYMFSKDKEEVDDLFQEALIKYNRQTDMLHERIQRLQPCDRAIVLLWLENMSYDEIAQIVGIGVKNVSVRLYRIKEQLKQMN